MRKYDLIKDFNGSGEGDYASVTPRALIAVWRYARATTYDRTKLASFSANAKDGFELRSQNPVYLIHEDIASLTVGSSKTSHLITASIELFPGNNYLNEVLPGDWMAIWIVNSESKLKELIEKLQNGDPCNHFNDGIKFIGKAQATRKTVVQSPSGPRMTRYSMQAVGFSELDNQVYYEPQLQNIPPGPASEILGKTGQKINDLIVADAEKGLEGTIPSSKAIAFFYRVLLGGKVPRSQGFDTPLLTQLENTDIFTLPAEVSKAFNVPPNPERRLGPMWADLCQVVIGVQTYGPGGGTSPQEVFAPDGLLDKAFGGNIPNLLNDQKPVIAQNVVLLNKDLLGTFLPNTPQFTGQKSAWSYFTQFLNPTVNELYVSLRVGADGYVRPTLTARQLPFTTNKLNTNYKPFSGFNLSPEDIAKREQLTSNAPRDIVVTRFLEVPRWVAAPVLVKSIDVGRSNAMRFNVVKIMAETGTKSTDFAAQTVRDPPIIDQLDFLRSGLRPYITTVNCSERDAKLRKSGEWQYLVSDWLMDGHMYLTGSVTLQGIQAPICIGDNFQVDQYVFHIESVQHQFRSDGSGNTQFSTSLSLTYGQVAEDAQAPRNTLEELEAPQTKDRSVNTDSKTDYQLAEEGAENSSNKVTGSSVSSVETLSFTSSRIKE